MPSPSTAHPPLPSWRAATGTVERNVREWLSAQAAAGYVTYDGPDPDRFSLSPEQAEAFTNEGSPAFVVGGFQVVTAAAKADEKVTEAFRGGEGVGWHEHHRDLFDGTERFFRPGYAANLVDAWLPALDGVVEKLRQRRPRRRRRLRPRRIDDPDGAGIPGIDVRRAPTTTRRRSARRARPPRWPARATPGSRSPPPTEFVPAPYDLVCYFDCLHDMGDPVGALRHARTQLAEDGVVMLVEPQAGDTVADNLNPVGRVFYGGVVADLHPGLPVAGRRAALGAQAGEARLTEVAREAGFTRVRRAAETPFNLVLELRP